MGDQRGVRESGLCFRADATLFGDVRINDGLTALGCVRVGADTILRYPWTQGREGMSAKVKDGKAFEQLISIIEKVVAADENVTVEPNKKLTDKVTGERRQFDVVLTVTHQHHVVVVAIECKDKTRPVGVLDLEAFHTKCQHAGINQGVIVSTSGFAKTVRTKAEFLGIRCLDIEEVASFNWMLADGMHVIERKLHHQSWKFFPETEGLVDESNMELLDDKGNVLDPAVLTANARRILNEQLPDLCPPTEPTWLEIRVNGKGLTLRNSQTGATTPVRFGDARLIYSVAHSHAPHRLMQYVEKSDDKHITDAAVAEFQLGDKTMRMIIVHKEGEGGEVYLAVASSRRK